MSGFLFYAGFTLGFNQNRLEISYSLRSGFAGVRSQASSAFDN